MGNVLPAFKLKLGLGLGLGERYVCTGLSTETARGVRSSSESSEMTSMSYMDDGEATTEGSSSVGMRNGERTRPGERRGLVERADGDKLVEVMHVGDE